MRTEVPALARANAVPSLKKPGIRRNRADLLEAIIGLAFVTPVALIVVVFELLPVLYGFFLSMQGGENVPEGFVGLDHFIQAIGSFGYMIAFAVATIFALVGWNSYRIATQAMGNGEGNFYPYLLPAFVTAPTVLVVGLMVFNGLYAYLPVPILIIALGLGWFQWLQTRRGDVPGNDLRYPVNSFVVALMTLSAVVLTWFTFSELHRRVEPMYAIIRAAITDGRYNYVEPLFPQILAIVGSVAALGAIFAIGGVRGQLDPDAHAGSQSGWGLLRAALVVVMAGFVLYIFGVQDLLRVSLTELSKLSAEQLRTITRFRLPRVVDTATEWQQIYMAMLGMTLIVLAWLAWQQSRQRETSLGLVTGLGIAICLLAGGWLFLGELPIALAKGDPEFYQSLIRTVIYAALTVPIQLVIGLGLAYLLYYEITWGKTMYRLIYFIPYIAPTVATATVFAMIFSSDTRTGPINVFMQSIGLPPQEWLRNPKGVFQLIAEFIGGAGTRLPQFLQGPALPLLAAIIYGIWVFSGYNAVIFMAGFANVPKDIYEAAAVDGANRWATFRKIIFPMISPTTFFLSLLAIIGTFRAFTHIWVLRQDDRGGMDTTVVYIFQTITQASAVKTRPYAAALSFLLFGIILILTIVQNRLSKDRVFYG